MTDEFEILRRLEDVFEDVFGEPILLTPSTKAEDVDAWDSVKTVELVVAIERAFDVHFSLGEIAKLANVGQLVERIEKSLR